MSDESSEYLRDRLRNIEIDRDVLREQIAALQKVNTELDRDKAVAHCRIADLEGWNQGLTEQIAALTAELAQAKDRAGKLEIAAKEALPILDHIASAVGCTCDTSVGWVCETCEAKARAWQLRQSIGAPTPAAGKGENHV